MYVDYLKHKLVTIKLEATDDTLIACTFVSDTGTSNPNDITNRAVKELNEYFNGSRTEFEVPVALNGTEFQQECYQALIDIPYGETRSYQQQATAINRPKAVRAVGGANNKNRVAIFIPCHRVIGKNGKLVGYAGGLPFKEYLLDLESRYKL
jgi:methylated-DNA-[protein]-cysteine S-methyltransferase